MLFSIHTAHIVGTAFRRHAREREKKASPAAINESAEVIVESNGYWLFSVLPSAPCSSPTQPFPVLFFEVSLVLFNFFFTRLVHVVPCTQGPLVCLNSLRKPCSHHED